MNKYLILFIFIVFISISGLKILPGKDDNVESTKTSDSELVSVKETKLNELVNVEFTELGIMKASWYGPRFHGRLTANGEIYDQMGLTVAHKSLPFGTLLRLTNPVNNKSLVVRINDRGPYIPGRQIDLSMKVAMILGVHQRGVAKLKVEKINVNGVTSPVID